MSFFDLENSSFSLIIYHMGNSGLYSSMITMFIYFISGSPLYDKENGHQQDNCENQISHLVF